MKVKELIAALSMYGPEEEVYVSAYLFHQEASIDLNRIIYTRQVQPTSQVNDYHPDMPRSASIASAIIVTAMPKPKEPE